MKIHLARYEDHRLGGGWTFQKNLIKALGDKYEPQYEKADWFFIASASMIAREEVEQAKRDGKKILLRVDNILRNSRNRSTGMPKMRDYANIADVVVYQSEFAKNLLKPYLNKDGSVIINGADTAIYHDRGRRPNKNVRYLFSRYSRDETKNWEIARSTFQQRYLEHGGRAELKIIGRYSRDMHEANFDFYMNERYKYLGVSSDPNYLANLYRDTDYFLYTYWNDACSNTLIEALLCGCQIDDEYGMANTGGAPEIIWHFENDGASYFELERMGKEYLELLQETA